MFVTCFARWQLFTCSKITIYLPNDQFPANADSFTVLIINSNHNSYNKTTCISSHKPIIKKYICIYIHKKKQHNSSFETKIDPLYNKLQNMQATPYHTQCLAACVLYSLSACWYLRSATFPTKHVTASSEADARGSLLWRPREALGLIA